MLSVVVLLFDPRFADKRTTADSLIAHFQKHGTVSGAYDAAAFRRLDSGLPLAHSTPLGPAVNPSATRFA
jgi:hypothetical protein